MARLKSAVETEKEIKKILSDRVTEIADLEEQIKKDQENIDKASEEMEEATATGELSIYKKAKEKLSECQLSQEMHRKRFNKLQYEILISKEEYEKKVAAIFEEYNSFRIQTGKKLAKLSEEMKKEADELLEAYEHINNVLYRLQHELYKDSDRLKAKNGDLIDRPKEIRGEPFIYWGNIAVDSGVYKDFRREEEEEND